jgi:hypothetical protein
MEEWLQLATKDAVIIIDAMAFIIVAIGTAGFATLGRATDAGWWPASFPARIRHHRDVDCANLAEVGKLGVIAAIRTLLNFFLERDLGELRDRAAEPLRANPADLR